MKLYHVTQHAIERAVERLGRHQAHAKHELNQLMQRAVYVGSDGNGRIFDHYSSRTRLIVAKESDTIITVYSMDQPIENINPVVTVSVTPKQTMSNAIIEKARAVIQRELAKSQRKYTAEYRALSLEQAELAVEIAQANVKKVRCKAPHTQALIQERIDSLQAYHQAIETKLNAIKAEHDRMTAEAMAFVEA